MVCMTLCWRETGFELPVPREIRCFIVCLSASNSGVCRGQNTKPGVVALAVSDTGIGLDAEQQGRLFEPFSQADNPTTRRYGGTGLGVSIVHPPAQLMGGDVAVSSEPDVGSTFTVTLCSPPPQRRRHSPHC